MIMISLSATSTYITLSTHIGTGKLDLAFHAGPRDTSLVIGICQYHHLSSDMDIGLGDPNGSHTIAMETVRTGGSPQDTLFIPNQLCSDSSDIDLKRDVYGWWLLKLQTSGRGDKAGDRAVLIWQILFDQGWPV
ncbi:hypothetical protein N7495_009618 [Penicillium taxi]|uniref:uncharacterized protein n=1 Tax=Penicillium taxi TaxID=168475 RepID=UPI002544FF92|nr:uncharacterized protein N7495_009618 [Penicillium taxi]KAJ5885108.1 hypothetical protein N7495_009618 [Penicillium taxi]